MTHLQKRLTRPSLLAICKGKATWTVWRRDPKTPLTLLAVAVGAEEQGRVPKLAKVSLSVEPTEAGSQGRERRDELGDCRPTASLPACGREP